MPTIKAIISIIAISLTFVGYAPYIKDIIKGKTRPHLFSWFVWGVVTLIAFALQFEDGAGVGAFVTLFAALISFLIFALALKNGKKDIEKSDIIFFLMSLIALFLWVVAKKPLLSIILVSLTEILGFIPTIRKSWKDPFSETLFTYALNSFRHGLGFFALEKYSLITTLYPITWVVTNGLFALMLIYRRKKQ